MMEESGSDGIHSGSIGDDFPDSLLDNSEIVDAVDLTHEMSGHQNGEASLRMGVVEDEHVSKKKKVDTVHFMGSKSMPTNHLLHLHGIPTAFSLPPASMIAATANGMSGVLNHSAVVGEAIHLPCDTTVIDGVTYNNRGYEICGSLNKFNKPCQRIGRNCPFHAVKEDPSSSRSPQAQPQQHSPSSPGIPTTPNTPNSPSLPPSPPHVIKQRKPNSPSSPNPPIKKGPYKRGWTREEHIRFLKGLQYHGKGSWKEISGIVGTRSPSQIQVHAHRYFLRQQQGNKNKRSIHDFTLDDLTDLEGNPNHLQTQPPIQPTPHSSYPAQQAVEVMGQPSQLGSQYYVQPNNPSYSNQASYVQYGTTSPSQFNNPVPAYSSSPYSNSWSYSQAPVSNGYSAVQGTNIQAPMNQQGNQTQQWPQYANGTAPSYASSTVIYSTGSSYNRPNFVNGHNYGSTAPSYSTSSPSFITHGQSSGNGQTYTSNGQSYTSNSQTYAPNSQTYAPNSQTYAPNSQTYAPNAQTYTSNGQSYTSNPQTYASNSQVYSVSGQSYGGNGHVSYMPQGSVVDGFRLSLVEPHQEEHQVQDQYRKHDDRDFNHNDYNKDLQSDKVLFLKDLPDIFLRSEIANEPIK